MKTTWEEAITCPGLCERPMKEVLKHRAADGQGMIHYVECQTELCDWYDERKAIQVLPDGSIPIRESSKEFKAYTPGEESHHARVLEFNERVLQTGDLGELR